MKKTSPAIVALFVALPLLAQTAQKKPPAPATSGVTISTNPTPPPGSKPAEIQDVRLLEKEPDNPYDYERYGLSAFQSNDLEHARGFFEKSWKHGELPTAAYNLACVDVREGKSDAAFVHLQKAIGVGYDDEQTLLKDQDLAPIRADARFASIVASARKNRAEGDAAVVKEGTFVAPGKDRPVGILLLLHDKSSDPVSASGPFLDAARARGLFVAVPRAPARAGHKRFGWGSPQRAMAAVDLAVAEARRRAGNPQLPVFTIGVGFGGSLAFTAAAQRGGLFVGVGSVGGAFDPGTANAAQAQAAAASLRSARLFFGVPADAPHGLVAEIGRGVDALKQFGLSPTLRNWPGSGNTFPDRDVAKAVKETLDGVMGTGGARG